MSLATPSCVAPDCDPEDLQLTVADHRGADRAAGLIRRMCACPPPCHLGDLEARTHCAHAASSSFRSRTSTST